MAKVKIQGNASGAGVLTVTAPNTATDRTITLPDATGTLTFTPGITDNSNATAITIDSSEQVGIGQTNPSAQLHLKQTSGDQFLKMEGAITNWGWRNQSDGTHGLFDFTNSRWLYLGNNSYVSFQPGGTEKFKITSDGRGLSQFTAKVWVNFNGTGTIAIRDSHNVSSLTDNSTGYYTINFSNNLANANFCEVVGADQYHSTVDNGTQTTGLFKIGCFNSANGWADAVQVRGLVFGD
jgi:hypothetical protein